MATTELSTAQDFHIFVFINASGILSKKMIPYYTTKSSIAMFNLKIYGDRVDLPLD